MATKWIQGDSKLIQKTLGMESSKIFRDLEKICVKLQRLKALRSWMTIYQSPVY